MGGNNTTLEIDHRVWESGVSHETSSKIFNREKALSSYMIDEKLSFGKVDKDILKKLFDDNFQIIEKGEDYIDGVRKKYTNMIDCCTKDVIFEKDMNVVLSCSNDTKTFNNDFCDDTMYQLCTKERNDKCKAWITSQVQRRGKYFNDLLLIASMQEKRSDEYVIAFLEAMRNFNTDSNNYNNNVDNILNSYSETIQKNEYKCSFPSFAIIEKEKELQTAKECWYKECVLSPLYKLKTENIKKRNLCSVTICDIDIKKLDMSVQDLQILCKNKYNNKRFDIKDNPVQEDIYNIFFIPEFKNTLLPIYIIFSICFLFNK